MFKVLGWRALLIHGDPCVLDRWLWLRARLRKGALRTFDAGCGNGAFTIYAASEGNSVLAASFSEGEQNDARRRAEQLGLRDIDFRVLDLREIAQHTEELGTFEQIICLETIEHVLDDEGLVRSLAGMLEPGGRLLLTTPFDRHRPLFSEDPSPTPIEDGLHVRFGYSQARLREVLAQAGLEASEEGFVSGVISQQLTNLMRILTRRIGLPASWAVLFPLRALVVLDRPLTRLLRYPYLSVAVCGVRPS
jgi:SAM-dependent methyltransferase